MPDWGPDLSGIDFDDVIYFQKLSDRRANNWDDVPDKIKQTFASWNSRSGTPIFVRCSSTV